LTDGAGQIILERDESLCYHSANRSRSQSIIKTGIEQSDAEIVAMVKSGDTGAYGELVQRHKHAVCGIVSGMIFNRDDIDDLVQDIFVQAYKSIGSFRCESAFSTWIYRIAVNMSIKHIKKCKRRQAVSIDDPDTGLGDVLMSADSSRPDTVVERNARIHALRQAVDMLPDKHRTIVVLRYFRDLSCEEIARILDCSVGTVWSRLHYACMKLQKQLAWFAGEGL